MSNSPFTSDVPSSCHRQVFSFYLSLCSTTGFCSSTSNGCVDLLGRRGISFPQHHRITLLFFNEREEKFRGCAIKLKEFKNDAGWNFLPLPAFLSTYAE